MAGAPHRDLVMHSMEILAPTFLEYWAMRLTLPHARTSWAGVRLARWKWPCQGSIVVVCGLAGALAPGLCPGTVLIPEWVGLTDGRIVYCDPALVQALVTAARTLHLRNHAEDLARGVEFFPPGWRAEDMHAYARRNLALADAYTNALPPGPVLDFCSIPLALAYATLESLAHGNGKLSRSEVLKIVDQDTRGRL